MGRQRPCGRRPHGDHRRALETRRSPRSPFIAPFEAHNTAHFALLSEPPASTRVTWAMLGKRLLDKARLFMDVDAMLGKDFERGLPTQAHGRAAHAPDRVSVARPSPARASTPALRAPISASSCARVSRRRDASCPRRGGGKLRALQRDSTAGKPSTRLAIGVSSRAASRRSPRRRQNARLECTQGALHGPIPSYKVSARAASRPRRAPRPARSGGCKRLLRGCLHAHRSRSWRRRRRTTPSAPPCRGHQCDASR